MTRNVLASGLTFLIAVSWLHAVEPVTARATQINQSTEVKKSLGKELTRLQNVTGLSGESIAAIERSLQSELDADVKRQAARKARMSIQGRLSTQLLTAITGAAQKLVTDKAAFQKYKDDVDQRVALDQRATRDSFVQAVNAIVGLTSEQSEKVKMIADKLQKAGKIDVVQFAFYRANGTLTPFEKDLSGVLTTQQRKYFKEFSPGPSLKFVLMQDKGIALPLDARKENLTAALRMVNQMKLSQLDEELKLTDQQKRKLELIGKSIISRVMPERIKAEDTYRAYMKAWKEGNRAAPRPTLELTGMAMSSVVDLFDNQRTRWDRYVDSTLTGAQKTKWQALEDERFRASRAASTYLMLFGFNDTLALNGQQLAATFDLMIKHVETLRGSALGGIGFMESQRSLLKIPAADYIKAMGKDKWNQFKPTLDEIREDLKKADEAKKARR